MGKFDKFKGKGNSQKGNIVVINKYESKSAVLNLISQIVTAQNEFDIRSYFIPIQETVESFLKREKEKSDFFMIDEILDDLDFKIYGEVYTFLNKLESNHGVGRMTIAVGGGYSSGKSSFLNKISGIGHLLPTGVEPVSIVNTLLTYSTDAKNLIIRGKNIRGAYVSLNKDVLQSIQHSSKSKIYVAGVLENILIDIPKSEEFLNNVTFVDTPGYNNSTSKNIENSKADKDTAMEGMKNADAFIWCIDMEAGTIPSDDINMIKKILDEGGQKPYIIIFTKRDKKELGEQKRIILEANKIARTHLPYKPASIIGFSDREENPYLVPATGVNIETFIKSLRYDMEGLDMGIILVNSLRRLINESIGELQKLISEHEAKRLELSEEKSRIMDIKNKVYLENDNSKKDLKEFFLNHYDELLQAIQERNSLIDTLEDALVDSLNREVQWQDKTGFFSDSTALSRKHDRALDKYNSLKWPDGYPYYDSEYRSSFLNFLTDRLDDCVEVIADEYRDLQNKYDVHIKVKKQAEECIKSLHALMQDLNRLSKECFNKFSHDIKKYYDGIEMTTDISGDIFSAIASDNVEMFTSCLSEGVDFSICNSTGYNPITYIAHCGNNEMMKYLIDHDVDLSLKDNRGHTAFETAVIDHYKDICELILKKEPEAKNTDVSLRALSSKNTFNDWLKQI
ncbi:MAG: dynamin family protein [Duncaniella sp.]|nr:dynamin family protein [Duncaniella sp.]